MFPCTLSKQGTISEYENQQLYVIGWHQFALYYWAKALAEKKIKPGALLLHIDFHADHLNDHAADYKYFNSPIEVKCIIERNLIQYNSYIVPAIRWGIVNEVAFCSYDPKAGTFLSFKNHREVTVLENWFKDSVNKREKDVILNIDLDYFFEPPDAECNPCQHKHEMVIKREVESINRLLKYSNLTTIATSPHCGDKKSRRYIQSVFTKYFEVDINLDESKLVSPPCRK